MCASIETSCLASFGVGEIRWRTKLDRSAGMNDGGGEPPFLFKTSRIDRVLISTVLLFSLAAVIWIARERPVSYPASSKALIFQDSRLLKEVNLGRDNVFEIIDGRMRLEVKDGKIRVLSSDCHQHVCVNTGWIKSAGQTIVCVPNRVLIEIKSVAPQRVDAVAY